MRFDTQRKLSKMDISGQDHLIRQLELVDRVLGLEAERAELMLQLSNHEGTNSSIDYKIGKFVLALPRAINRYRLIIISKLSGIVRRG